MVNRIKRDGVDLWLCIMRSDKRLKLRDLAGLILLSDDVSVFDNSELRFSVGRFRLAVLGGEADILDIMRVTLSVHVKANSLL